MFGTLKEIDEERIFTDREILGNAEDFKEKNGRGIEHRFLRVEIF